MRIFNPRRILVPTDFSPTADHAFSSAQMLAARFHAEIVVVHCDFLPTDIGYAPTAYVTSLESDADLLDSLQRYADERLAQGSVPYRTEVVHDASIAGISRMADKADVDLIVIGSHGRTGWRRAILGSVAEGVMRATSRPVLTVHKRLASAMRRVLCPVDLTLSSRNAIDYAASLAVAFDAELLIVHVLDMSGRLFVDEQASLREMIPPEVRERCRHAEFVPRGNPGEELAGFAERYDASLIVLGARHDRFRDPSVMGSTSEHISRLSTIPVLTIVSPLADQVGRSAIKPLDSTSRSGSIEGGVR